MMPKIIPSRKTKQPDNGDFSIIQTWQASIMLLKDQWFAFAPCLLFLVGFNTLLHALIINTDAQSLMANLSVFFLNITINQVITLLLIALMMQTQDAKATSSLSQAIERTKPKWLASIAGGMLMMMFSIAMALVSQWQWHPAIVLLTGILSLVAMLRLMFFPFTLLIDAQRLLNSFQASFLLTQGHVIRLIGLLVLPAVLFLALLSIIHVAAATPADGEMRNMLFLGIIDLLIFPLTYCLLYQAYQQLKTINTHYLPTA